MPLKTFDQHGLVRAFWIAHLTLCVLFAAPDVLHLAQGWTWRVLGTYGAYTGAANRYGFFAPNVPNARRIRVRALCGGRWLSVDSPLRGWEAQQRLTTISSLVMRKEVEEGVAGSWAAFAFNHIPCAEVALVEVDHFQVPAMDEYRAGQRPAWKLLRVFTFAKGRGPGISAVFKP